MILILLISFMLLCTGCGADSLHGEFLVVVMEENHCILKPLDEKIPEELKFSSGEVCPVQASIPETIQEAREFEDEY